MSSNISFILLKNCPSIIHQYICLFHYYLYYAELISRCLTPSATQKYLHLSCLYFAIILKIIIIFIGIQNSSNRKHHDFIYLSPSLSLSLSLSQFPIYNSHTHDLPCYYYHLVIIDWLIIYYLCLIIIVIFFFILFSVICSFYYFFMHNIKQLLWFYYYYKLLLYIYCFWLLFHFMTFS